MCVCAGLCVHTKGRGGGATEWWWWWWEHSVHGSLYVHVVFVSRVQSSRHTWNPPPPPPHLTPYSQDFYDAFHRPQRKPPPDVKAAMAALSQHPLQAACTIPGLLAHLRAYIQVWAPLVSTQRTHREGERAVCAHPATHAVPPSLPAPLPVPPPTHTHIVTCNRPRAMARQKLLVLVTPVQATPGSPPLGVGPSTGAAAGVTPISGHSKKA